MNPKPKTIDLQPLTLNSGQVTADGRQDGTMVPHQEAPT